MKNTKFTQDDGNRFYFSHDPKAFGRSDGGGITRIEARDKKSIIHLNNHFELTDDPVTVCQFIDEGSAVATLGTEKRPSFVTEVVNTEQFAAYLKALKGRTGYEFQPTDHIPDLAPHYKWSGICHTHYVESAEILGCEFRAVVHDTSEDWDGRKAADRAPRLMREHVAETLSDREVIREFVHAYEVPGHRGNAIMRNPAYASGRKGALKNNLGCEEIFDALMRWWMDNHATDEQLDIVAKDEALYEKLFPAIGHVGSLRENKFERGLRTSWESDGFISWEDFAAKGKTPIAATA